MKFTKAIGSFQQFVDVNNILTPKALKEFRIPGIQPAYLDTNVTSGGKVTVHVVIDMDEDWKNPDNQDRYELGRTSKLLRAHCRG